MAHVVVCGTAVLDHRVWVTRWPPARGRTPATAYVEDLGGPGAVAAVAVARLGGSACLVGPRGADAAGERVAAFLRAHGVAIEFLRPFAGARTPVSSIVIVPGGERFIFPYAGEGLPDDPGWAPLAALHGADAVLVDSHFPRAGRALAAAAHARGLPVVLDLDSDTEAAWSLAGAATHAIADEELAARAGGVDAVLARLAAHGIWGAVTLGPAGVRHRGGHVPGFPVSVHDSTGAGDVFHGAFALALAERQAPDGALVFASAAAALRCETGRVPERRAVEEFLAAASRRGD